MMCFSVLPNKSTETLTMNLYIFSKTEKNGTHERAKKIRTFTFESPRPTKGTRQHAKKTATKQTNIKTEMAK